MEMNSKEIKTFKIYPHRLFEELLPYKAKNGVYFKKGSVSFTTQYGIIFGDNGYSGEDTYYPMLRHIETAGDGSTAYDTNFKVGSFTAGTLEVFAKAIETNITRNAKKALKGFT